MVRRGIQQYTHRGYHAKHPREGAFFKKLLKQISPNSIRLAVTSSHVLTSLLREFSKDIINTALEIESASKKRTLSAKSIQTAVRLCLNGELSRHAVASGVQAVSQAKTDKKPAIPISYVRNQIKSSLTILRISKSACFYLSAVLEYLLSEILELSINRATNDKKRLITPRFIFLSICCDEELNKTFNKPGTIFVQGGPYVFGNSYF
ncbi:hypothetical protein CYY_004438 [Polysphondylium violaceum]|uniref:Transcription factor CBF/NF-Y/archaeal histone domain-containing protein n=1 Tax=Polysphondylium violaceum TaxID=133409 RepID=A0A8J4V7S1_9MYCE|nr:hypothetical protein CYY_004438 [Polysphondylium violaceum]